MRQFFDNLWQGERYSSGVLNTHAYFLQRKEGNILFYNTGASADLDQIEVLGGIDYQLLTHRDEVGGSLARIKERFNSKLGIGDLEVSFAEEITPVDLSFSATDTILDGIQIIHTPGHTDGSVCYYYAPPDGKSYLFTGDTIFQSNGSWSTFVLSSHGGTNTSLVNSLEKLGELSPDVVMSSGFVGEIAFREVTRPDWVAAIDDAIMKLR